MSRLGVGIIYNHADYRLIDRTVLNCFLNYKEVNLFLRGIFPLIGFTIATVPYDRNERFAGKSKYPLKKMMAFALDGITSFSIVPLRFVSVIGLMYSYKSSDGDLCAISSDSDRQGSPGLGIYGTPDLFHWGRTAFVARHYR